MKEISDNFERIETYLFDEMDAPTKAAFESELAHNPALAAEVKQQAAELRAMEILHQQDFRADMLAWEAERPSEKTAAAAPAHTAPTMQAQKGGRFLGAYVRMAIAACMLLGVAVWFLRSGGGSSPEQLFADSAIILRGNTDDIAAPLKPTYDILNKQNLTDADYLAALAALDQVQGAEWEEDVRLLKGDCFFHLRQYDKTLEQLLPVAQKPVYWENGQKAEWCLLLTYLKKQDKANAQKWFDKIKGTPGHKFQGEAYLEKVSL